MSKQTNAAAVAGMIAGHKMYNRRKAGNYEAIPNPYHRARNTTEMVCGKAWNAGMSEGMQHAANGMTMQQLGKILLGVQS